MEIKTIVGEDRKEIMMQVVGRINITTSTQLEAALHPWYNVCEKLVLDFSGVDYISSAGFRVLLEADNSVKPKGTLVVKNLSADVREVFDMTGFSDLLAVE